MRTLTRPLRRRRARQKGMTLLEIMIVLAILALVMGFLVGPRVYRAFQDSKEDTQKAVNKQWVEGYVMWSRRNQGCPTSLNDLAEYVNKKATTDAWNRELLFFCGDTLPPGVKEGFAVLSLGADGQQNTADDIKSWE